MRAAVPAIIVNPSTRSGRARAPDPDRAHDRRAALRPHAGIHRHGLNLVHVDVSPPDTSRRCIMDSPALYPRRRASVLPLLGDIAALVGQAAAAFRLSRRMMMPLAYLYRGWAVTGREPLLTPGQCA